MSTSRATFAIAGLMLATVAPGAAAQSTFVEAVQSPAWLERAGRAVALAPGVALLAQDRVVTGPNARVRLKLASGDVVNLGHDATLVIPRDGERGSIASALREAAVADPPDSEKAAGWKVVAAIHPTRDAALAMARQLRAAGFPAEIQALEGYQLVQVLRLESEAQARNVMANLRGQPGVTLPKVVPMH